jgi:hypothetical protein
MTRFKLQFLNQLPPALEAQTLYVSMQYGTVIHLCACGCGRKVVTPLSPNDWKLTFDGRSLTLSPSIGNWQYPCRSHYWVRNSRVEWADDSGWPPDTSPTRSNGLPTPAEPPGARVSPEPDREDNGHGGFWRRLQRRWRTARLIASVADE